MEMRSWQLGLALGALALALPSAGYGAGEQNKRVISNTAIVSYTTSGGRTVLVESSPDGNGVPGEGHGEPVILVVPGTKEPVPSNEEGGR